MRLTKTTKSNQVSVPSDFRKENIPNTSRKHYRLSYLAHSHSLYPRGKTSGYPMTRSASKNRSQLKLDIGSVPKQGTKNLINATGEFEATFKLSDLVCNTSVWGAVYILDITATNRLKHNQFQEPPKWFNNSCENRTKPWAITSSRNRLTTYTILALSAFYLIRMSHQVRWDQLALQGRKDADYSIGIHVLHVKKTTAISHTLSEFMFAFYKQKSTIANS